MQITLEDLRDETDTLKILPSKHTTSQIQFNQQSLRKAISDEEKKAISEKMKKLLGQRKEEK